MAYTYRDSMHSIAELFENDLELVSTIEEAQEWLDSGVEYGSLWENQDDVAAGACANCSAGRPCDSESVDAEIREMGHDLPIGFEIYELTAAEVLERSQNGGTLIGHTPGHPNP